MKLNTKAALLVIDRLIAKAKVEKEKHVSDDTYLGSADDIATSNAFFNEIGTLLGIDVAEDDKWGACLLKATSTAAYDFAIGQLLALKSNFVKKEDAILTIWSTFISRPMPVGFFGLDDDTRYEYIEQNAYSIYSNISSRDLDKNLLSMISSVEII